MRKTVLRKHRGAYSIPLARLRHQEETRRTGGQVSYLARIEIPFSLAGTVGDEEIDGQITCNIPVLIHENPADDESDWWEMERPTVLTLPYEFECEVNRMAVK